MTWERLGEGHSILLFWIIICWQHVVIWHEKLSNHIMSSVDSLG